MATERQIIVWSAAAAGLAFVLWKWGNPIAPIVIGAAWVQNFFTRGNELSQSTVVSDVVQEVPEVLADMATAVLGVDVDREIYALARMGRSEGVDGMEFRMHVLLNDWADLRGRYPNTYPSIESMLTHSKNPASNGHFSAQKLGKRYASTKDPFEGDYALAQKVVADQDSGLDPTNGATKFVDKSGPFYIHDPETGESVKTDYAGIVAAWGRDGYVPNDALPGATSNFVVFTRDA